MPTTLPKRIKPDRLKNTFVELRFKSKLPYQLLPGLLYPTLKSDFQIQPRFNNPKALQLDPTRDIWMGVEPREHIFRSEKTTLKIDNGSFVFDMVSDYSGWSDYSTTILEASRRLLDSGYLDGIDWMGIRYVSEYPDIAVFDCVTWVFKFENPPNESFNTTFRTEWRDDQDTIIVNLANNLHFTWENAPKRLSIIDVDVNTALPITTDLAIITDTLERLHTKEKSTFFGLLSDVFLKSLNPEY